MRGLFSAKSEYSRLVSASLNIRDRSYCVQRDSEGERASVRQKENAPDFPKHSCERPDFCPGLLCFLSWSIFSSSSSGLLPGPRARVSLFQRLCPISIFMISGGRMEGGGEGHVLSKEQSISDRLMYNLNPPLWSTAPLNWYMRWWKNLSSVWLYFDTLSVQNNQSQKNRELQLQADLSASEKRNREFQQRCGKIYHSLLSDNKLSPALVRHHPTKKKTLWQTLLWPASLLSNLKATANELKQQ